MIKVAIVEDKAETLAYLQALLDGSNGVEVIGAYGAGREAIDGIERRRPDVALIDLGLPDISGIEVIRSLKESLPDLDIIAYTLHEDRKHLISALKAGATGYILKGASAVEIIQAVESVVAGGSPISPRIARYILEDYHTRPQRKDEVELTAREKEVLQGIAGGLPEKQLAERLSISPHTVHSYVKNIYKKLKVNSQAQAVLKARKKGIL